MSIRIKTGTTMVETPFGPSIQLPGTKDCLVVFKVTAKGRVPIDFKLSHQLYRDELLELIRLHPDAEAIEATQVQSTHITTLTTK